jgi:hypothetical protein
LIALLKPPRLLRLALPVFVSLVACAGGSTSGAPDADVAAQDTAKSDTPAPPPTWTSELVATGQGGRHVRLALGADGEPRVAWFATEGRAAGLCDAIVPDPPPAVTWPLYYAHRAAGAYPVETVADVLLVGTPVGLELAVGPDGASAIATLSGEPVVPIRYCGASDVGYYTRAAAGTWSVATAVATSGEAASGEPASDYGDVVGYWPSLAFDSAGQPIIAYKDVHSGSIQSDDFRRADLEVAWRQDGAWRALPVDVGQGAGHFTRLLMDAAGRPVIAAFNPRDDLTTPQRGLWMYRSADDGQSWQRVRIFGGVTTERPSLALDPADGGLWVAWYDATDRLPYLAHLPATADFEDAQAWQIEEIGDHRFNEGEHPSLAFAPDGRLALAYARCARATDAEGECNASVDGAVFALRAADGSFEREIVDGGSGPGSCGSYPNLAFGADGTAWVAYHCTVFEGGQLTDEVRLARRKALP